MSMLKETSVMLDGKEYYDEFNHAVECVENYARDNGVVIAYGVSDDLLELRGAYEEEYGLLGGVVVPLNSKKIKAEWCPKSKGCSWLISVDAEEFEEFTVMEEGDVFCYGVVFYL